MEIFCERFWIFCASFSKAGEIMCFSHEHIKQWSWFHSWFCRSVSYDDSTITPVCLVHYKPINCKKTSIYSTMSLLGWCPTRTLDWQWRSRRRFHQSEWQRYSNPRCRSYIDIYFHSHGFRVANDVFCIRQLCRFSIAYHKLLFDNDPVYSWVSNTLWCSWILSKDIVQGKEVRWARQWWLHQICSLS